MPVLNGRRSLRAAIDGILAQRDGCPFEIIAIDDGSTDGSRKLLEKWAAAGTVRLLLGAGRGAAAAINAGIREARQPVVCQVDQDVILQPGWLSSLLRALEDPDVAAAQGHYVTRRGAGFWARAMGRDLEHRYSKIRGRFVDHVCTGNTAYRARALHQVDLLDERLGYGYDNDLSYRLAGRGHRLAFCRDAISVHCWREDFGGYLRQQFGVGYGRLDVIARHPRRVCGDDVSSLVMMLHGPAMLVALAGLGSAVLVAALGGRWSALTAASAAIIGVLAIERTAAGFAAWRRTGDPAALAFAAAHLIRDCAWAAAIVIWLARRSLKRDAKPAHSMMRSAAVPAGAGPAARETLRPGALLVVVPAFNEASNLARVVEDLGRTIAAADILVVNDGSTDGTNELLPSLGVAWLTMSQRLGVGGAVRAGIRYATQSGYEYVVRVDGDGQHRACDIARLLAPVVAGRADAAMGSRFLARGSVRGIRRMSQSTLAACLSLLTGRRVTDPTSGFWLFGPRALRLLGRHHPAGYAEPELVLLLSRNGLRVVEVPIRTRPRLSGRTSLTAARAALALARTALALVIVPFRRIVEGQPGD
jgi:hypothetical protein